MVRPEQRFIGRVDDYASARPGYPDGVGTLLRTRCGLGPAGTAADLGSGTGIFTRLLLETGATVYAVEPNEAMRTYAEQALAAWPGFRSLAVGAEATGLADASVDLVSAAQAAHWFEVARARAEIRRILRPGGWLALIWNLRRTDSTPFLREYEELLLGLESDYRDVSARHGDPALAAELFAPDPFETREFENPQTFDLDGLKRRTLSCSYTPQPGQAGHEAMIASLERMFARYSRDGLVRMEHDTRLFLGRLG